MDRTLMFLVVAACLLVVAMALPFNAVENPHFYNGDVARKPYFAIQEHLWPGLTKKDFTLGGR